MSRLNKGENSVIDFVGVNYLSLNNKHSVDILCIVIILAILSCELSAQCGPEPEPDISHVSE